MRRAFVHGGLLVSLSALALGVAGSTALGAARPPAPTGVAVLAPGTPPHICGAADGKYGATGYSPVMGVYYSKTANAWISAPLCYPRWGNLQMSAASVAAGGSKATVVATPSEGSNSAEWATKPPGAISWQPGGAPVKGSCKPTMLTCTVMLPAAGPEWQWVMFHVSLPRTYFIDSKGEFCAGIHACPGNATQGWTFVGVPPKGVKPPEQKIGTVGGSVTETECTETACTQKPLAGVRVTLAGKAGTSLVTDETGRYSAEVEAGTYTVTPTLDGREFDPPKASVTVTKGGYAEAGFTTCAIVRTPQSRRRSLATCEPLRIDWTMPSHIRAAGWDDASPSATYVNPRGGWTVNLFLKNAAGKPLACRPGYTYTWKVSPRGTKQATVYQKRPCKLAVQVPREGVYSVTVEERNAKTGTVAASGAKDVTVQDFLIVGVGDSNGSGQANPPYWNRQCDRSDESYQMQAAESVERDDPRTSVTFVHLACSGARTVHLTTARYVGQEADPDNLLPPQLVALRTALRPAKSTREIDAIILSAGINDVRFGGIVGTCVGNAVKAHFSGNCPDIPVVRTLDAVGEPTLVPAKAGTPGAKPLREMVAEELAALPAAYALLARQIPTRVTVDPKRIIITQYPDESWRTETELCDERLGGNLPGLTRPEWEFLYQAGLGLASAVAATAAHGWTPVTTIPAKFRGHGWCTAAGKNWFRSVPRSLVGQGNEYGTFHTTRNGHIAMGIEVFGILCQQLFKNGTTACGGEAREPQPGALPK